MRKILPLLVAGILVLMGLGASATPFYDIEQNWEQIETLNGPKSDELDQSQTEMDFFST